MSGFVAEHGVGGHEGEGAAYPGEPTGEGRGYAQGEGGGYATGGGGGYTTREGGGYATGEGGGYATGEGGGYATGEGGGYATGEGGGYATGVGGGYAQGEGGGYATGEGGGYATGAGGEYATVQGEGYEQGEGGGNETGVGGGYATGAGGEYETREGDGYEGEEGGEDGGEEGGEDEGEEWGEEEGEEWGEDGTGEQGAYASGEGGVHATVQGGGYVTEEGGGYGTVRGGEDEGDEWGEGGTGEQGAYAAGEGGVHATVQGGGYEGGEGGENGTGEGGGYAAGEGGRYVVRGGKVYEEQEGGEFTAQGEGGYEAEEGGRVMAEGGEDGRARDPAEGDGALNAAVRQEAYEGGEDDTEDDDVERMLYPVRPVAEASRGSTMDESAEEAAAIMRGKAKCMATLNMDEGHGAEGGEKGEVGEQGGAEGEEGEAEDRMMERGKGVEGEAAAEQGGAEGEEGEAEDRMNKREKGVEGGASSVEGAVEIVERVNLAAGLEVEEGAKEWDEEEEGVPQARCSHPARSLPSFHPCLPAINRRCTEEEGGRGGGHSNHELGAISNGIGGRISGGARTAASSPASPASMGRAPVAHGPSDTHRGGGRERVRNFLTRSYSHPFLSLCPYLPAIGRTHTEEEGGRGTRTEEEGRRGRGEMHRGVGKEAVVCVSLHAACIGFDTYPATPLILSSVSVLISLPLAGNAQRWREGEAEMEGVAEDTHRGGGKERPWCVWASMLLEMHRGVGKEAVVCVSLHAACIGFDTYPATPLILSSVSLLISLPLAGNAQRWREGEAEMEGVAEDTHRGGGRERVRSAWARSYSHLFLSLCLLISPPLAGHAQRRREGEAVEMHRGVGKEAVVCVSLHAACIGFDSYPATPLILSSVSVLISLPLAGNAQRWREGEAEDTHRGGGRERVRSAWARSYSHLFLSLCLLISPPLAGHAQRRREGEAVEMHRGVGKEAVVCVSLHAACIGFDSYPATPLILSSVSVLISLPLAGNAQRWREGEAEMEGVAEDTHRGGGRERVRSAWARSYSHLFLSLCLLISPPLAGHAQRRREREAVEMHRGVGKEAVVCSLHAACIGFDSYPATPLILSSVSVLISLPLAGNAQRWREGEAEEMQRREGEAKVCVGLYIAPLCIALVSLTLLEIEQIKEMGGLCIHVDTEDTQLPFSSKAFAVGIRHAFTRTNVTLGAFKTRQIAYAVLVLECPLLEEEGRMTNNPEVNREKYESTVVKCRKWVELVVTTMGVRYDSRKNAFLFGNGVCIDTSDYPASLKKNVTG
ncbi:unnamed protein product [Closterium sp. NIES-64]|nr:unnamed protein product [Closterium sp. NIES-64]